MHGNFRGEVECGYRMSRNAKQPITVFALNRIIRDSIGRGEFIHAVKCYQKMQKGSLRPDKFTFPLLVKAAADNSDQILGKCIHGQVIKSGLEFNVYAANALISMYGKCQNTDDACQVFEKMLTRSLVSWNTLIAGYAHKKQSFQAVEAFFRMNEAGLHPDSETMMGMLLASAQIPNLSMGMEIHCYLLRAGLCFSLDLMNGLINMYMKCRNVFCARKVFESLLNSDVVSWTAMIAGYSRNCCHNEALRLFSHITMKSVSINLVDPVAVSSILTAVSCLASLHHGLEIHAHAVRTGALGNVYVGSGLIDMYVKCGDIEAAETVFKNLAHRNVVSWTTMIVGYAMHGYCDEAFWAFSEMQQSGIRPNEVTFMGLLSACSHGGLIDKAWRYFENMKKDYGIEPEIDHYVCMVDLLGRKGHIEEALHCIKQLSLEQSPVIWSALLSACRSHGNVNMGRLAANYLFILEPTNPGHYVLFSNILLEAGRLDEALKLKRSMHRRRLDKKPGCSWIEVKNKIHSFVAGYV